MPSYATDATTWRAYQRHLPPSLRLADDDLPAEETWRWDGLDVHLDRWSAPHGARCTVVVLHGGGGYGRLLAPYGRLLRDAGCDVLLPDLPGYGLTACPPREMRYARWVTCAAALAQEEAARSGRSVVLFGASMGGMLALHAAGVAPAGTVAGVAATTLMDPRRAEVRRAVGRVPLPAAALRLGVADGLRVPMPWVARLDRMSSVPEVNRLVARDPQGGALRVPVGFLRSWLTYDPPLEPRAFDRCPVLLAHPLADRWTPATWSLDVLQDVPAPTTYVGLERCEHLPIEEPGLTQLGTALGSWLDEVLAP